MKKSLESFFKQAAADPKLSEVPVPYMGSACTVKEHKMYIEIQRRDAISFLFLNGEDFPPSASHFAMEGEKAGGMILVALLSGSPAGMISLQKLNGAMDVNYLYVMESFHKKGVGCALLKKALRLSELPVTLRVIWGGKSCEALERLAERCGLEPSGSAEIFHCFPCEERSRKVWSNFYRGQGKRICLRSVRCGGRTLRFEEADDRLLCDLFRRPDSEFHLDDQRMDQHYSRLLVKGDRALAFTAVTVHGNRAIVDLAGVRKELRNTGMVFPPLFHLIQDMIDEWFELVIFTVYNENRPMRKLTESFLSGLISERKRQTLYRWIPTVSQLCIEDTKTGR